MREHRRVFRNFDGEITNKIHPVSYALKGDEGEGIRYAYDSCGRLTQVCDPDGNILHIYAYNGHGQITREVDGEGKETLYTYNGLGWKIREQVKVKRP